ncbi:hypothetical protein CBS101457_000659 [Exobasidium rhododendri]|nr:hypothetical protein CBS101457_000659 [Exobasidium rhododendri]
MWPFGSSNSSNSSNDIGTSSTSTPAISSDTLQDSPTSYFSSDSARFDQSRTAYDPSQAPNTQDLFSKPGFDISRLHPLAGLGKDEIEYLDIVDAQPSTLEGGRTALPSRGWSDDLCYGTGTTYLSGLAIGGMLGARDGLMRPLGVQSPTARLRLNAVLNQVTRRGSFFGNSAGVIALIYNIADASIDAARGKHDMAGSIAAGGISGALFKATAGVRPMAISSGIMMALAATWTTAKKQLL